MSFEQEILEQMKMINYNLLNLCSFLKRSENLKSQVEITCGRSSLERELSLPLPKPLPKPKPYIATEVAEEVFDHNSKKNKMLESSDFRMWVIATYWNFKGIVATNKDQYEAQLRRELRPAGMLAGYPKERITEVMAWLNKNADFDWKLETVSKYVDEIDLII